MGNAAGRTGTISGFPPDHEGANGRCAQAPAKELSFFRRKIAPRKPTEI
jgi:hypothetical protein